MEPLVSILIPAYNAQEWIADSIRSALDQSWSKKEVIVVDDGSTDNTLTVAKQFSGNNVAVLTQRHQGVSVARNTALGISNGEYIQWLDADDLLAPDKIERQLEALNRHGSKRTLLSGSWGYFFYRLNKATFTPTGLWCDLSPTEWLYRKLSQNLHMQPDNWLVSRELTELAGPWDSRLWRDNDGEYFCRILLASDGVEFVPQARSYYRKMGRRSLSYVGTSKKKLESLFLSMQLHIMYLRTMEDSQRVRDACLTYLQNWLWYFYPEKADLVSQLEEIAMSLGGRLTAPALGRKYAWLQPVLGDRVAKHVHLLLPHWKNEVQRAWDQVLFLCQSGRKAQLAEGLPTPRFEAHRLGWRGKPLLFADKR